MLITCTGCGKIADSEEFPNNKCQHCGATVSDGDLLISDDIKERLAFAHSLRRIKKFSEAKREFNNILAINTKVKDNIDKPIVHKAEMNAAALGYFLSMYEVSDYKWNKTTSSIEYCDCTSTSLSPVESSNFWHIADESINSDYKVICQTVEEKRKRNVGIKESIPRYHAAIVCDQSQAHNIEMAHKLYDILSTKADIFFAPKTVRNLPLEEREFYIYQAMRNPNIVPIMFAIYTRPFDFQYTNTVYQADIVRQCEDFAKTHQKDELYSIILGDGVPSDDMNEISIKRLNCRVVDDGASQRIADALMQIIARHIVNDEQELLWKNEGRLLPLNGDAYSPIILPDKGA